MTQAPVDIPDSLWERLKADPKRLAALVIAAVVALGLLGIFIVRPLLAGNSGTGSGGPAVQLPVPSDRGSETTPGAGIDTTGAPGSDDGTSGEPEVPADPVDPSAARGYARAALVAYRLDGALWVAAEDGTGPRRVTDSAGGAFALSPDGQHLVLVEQGELSLFTVASGARRVLGAAEPSGLSWHPDSSAVYAIRIPAGGQGASEVWRFPSDGDPAKVLRAGPASVALDGTLAAPDVPAFGTAPEKGSVWVVRTGQRATRVSVVGPARECAVEGGTMAYALIGAVSGDASGQGGGPEIRVARYDGTSDRRLVGPPATQRPFAYGHLTLSPNAEYLLFAEVGDDGYSRAFVAPVTGGSVRALTVRRDTYPVGWSADGSRIFFIEGNAFQGESTALMSVRPDGTGRRVIVEGAGF